MTVIVRNTDTGDLCELFLEGVTTLDEARCYVNRAMLTVLCIEGAQDALERELREKTEKIKALQEEVDRLKGIKESKSEKRS